MLYYLFHYLEKLNFPGAGVFQYISFRASLAIITSLLIYLVFGKRLIKFLQKKQVGEEIRNLGLEGQVQKKGTPTMGGLLIIVSIVIPTLLFSKLENVYILLMLFTTLMLGAIGFTDDYIKVFKKNKKGLAGKFKLAGQITVGIIVGVTLFFSEDFTVKQKKITNNQTNQEWIDVKKPITTIPFLKKNEFDYSLIFSFLGDKAEKWTWLAFVIVVVIVVTAVSNGANLTDGLDGLATGNAAIIGLTLAVFAYISGNFVFSDYLNVMYIPNTGELVIFILAFVGACVGFLWYNSFPAQIFMGDTGSLTLGGVIAVFAIVIRKEMLIPLLCGVFLIENLSVILQVSYFKYTKKKSGEGKRLFLMAPIHHHFQKKNIHESKIVIRFWILGIFFAILTFITLKLR